MLGLQKGFTAQSRGLGAAELGPIGIRLEKVHKPPEDMLGLGHGPWSIESSLEGENWGHGNDGQRSPPCPPESRPSLQSVMAHLGQGTFPPPGQCHAVGQSQLCMGWKYLDGWTVPERELLPEITFIFRHTYLHGRANICVPKNMLFSGSCELNSFEILKSCPLLLSSGWYISLTCWQSLSLSHLCKTPTHMKLNLFFSY